MTTHADKVYTKADGTRRELTSNPKQSAIASITTDMSANPNDNELKNKINEILLALRSANIISTS
jgi:hypothetical protein